MASSSKCACCDGRFGVASEVTMPWGQVVLCQACIALVRAFIETRSLTGTIEEGIGRRDSFGQPADGHR